MATHDWNNDGKNDMIDNYIEYQIYKDVTGDYRHTKPCIVYKGGKHYHFACNNTSEIKLYIEDQFTKADFS